MIDARPEARRFFDSLGEKSDRKRSASRGASPRSTRKEDKESKLAESALKHARSLMGRSSIRAICHRINQSSLGGQPLTSQKVREILSESIIDKRILDGAWLFLLWTLVEHGYLEPTSPEGTHFEATILVAELAAEHEEALRKKALDDLQSGLVLRRSLLSQKEQELMRLETQASEVSGDIARIKQEIVEMEAAIAERTNA
jgi:hypothetical protein